MKRELEGRRGDKEEEEEWMSGVRKGEDERERCGDANKKKKKKIRSIQPPPVHVPLPMRE